MRLDSRRPPSLARGRAPVVPFTIEPKLYAPELDIAIMIEDVIAVTEDGYENLSASAPRTVEEIERIMGAN